jgi:hypothetical protein
MVSGPPVDPPFVSPTVPPPADPPLALEVPFDPPQPVNRIKAAAMDAARVIVINIVECSSWPETDVA